VIPKTTWTLDGEEIPFSDWQAEAGTGGFTRATGRTSENFARRATQGSILKGYVVPTGKAFWEGRLSGVPWSVGGETELSALGYQALVTKRTGRYLYQTRDVVKWVDAAGPPHDYASAGKGSLAGGPTSNWIVVTQGATTAPWIAFWAPGETITRIAYEWATGSAPNINTGSGPSGTLTSISSPASPVDVTFTDAQKADMVVLKLQAASQTIRNLRVNGRAATDIFTTSDLARSVAAIAGLDPSLIVASAQNALPIDVEGGPPAALLEHAASIDDWRWLVLDDDGAGPKLDYGPWSRTWRVLLAEGTVANLVPLEVFNRVVVWWSDLASTRRSVTLSASPDPLAAVGILNEFQFDLLDLYENDTVPTQVANTILAQISRIRYAGPLEISAARDAAGIGNPMEVRPGDLVALQDFGLDASLNGRIGSVSYRPSRVTVGLEMNVAGRALRSRTNTPGLTASDGRGGGPTSSLIVSTGGPDRRQLQGGRPYYR
jgi:hypothetical protein